MSRLVTDWFRRAVIFASLCSPLFAVGTASAQGQTGYLLTTTNQLITFDVNSPALPRAIIAITGVNAGETLVGIDVRPENGYIYGLGVNHATDTMTVYAISERTGYAGVVGTGGFTGAGNLPDPSVARYGIDFNPAVDRLRVTTNQSGAGPAVPGLNFRINVTVGLLAAADNDINPAPVSIDEVAYTNNGRHGSITTLYTISSAQDALYIQTLPNSGTQTGAIALSQDLLAVHGFDLDSQAVTTANNTPVTAGSSQAFAVVTTAAGTGLVRINLLTGAVSALTPIANNTTNIRGFAVRDVRVPGSYPATTLDSGASSLVRFNTATPGTTTTSLLTGLVAGDVLVGIDLRPNTGQMYGLGFNSVANTVQLYRIEPWSTLTTSTAVAVGGPIAMPTAGATAFGFDFNPSVDRVRVEANNGNNFRLNPNNGALAGTDAGINPLGSVVTGAAYTNSYAQSLGLPFMATTLYTLDATNNALAIQNLPNSGTQTLSKGVTLNGAPLDFTTANGFDIPSGVSVTENNAPASGLSYAMLTVGGVTNLYSIDLATGAAAVIGPAFPGPRSGLTLGEAGLQSTTITVTGALSQVGVGDTVTLTATVVPSNVTGTISFLANGVSLGIIPIVNGQAIRTFSHYPVGNYQITANYNGSFDAGVAFSSTPFALTIGQFKQHFAEGATGFFQTDIGVLNTSTTNTTNIKLSLFPEGAPSFTQTFTLAPMTRRTLDINAIMATQGLSTSVSTLIESDTRIATTRQMTYGNPVYGATLESGIPETSQTWNFAEGATGPYSLYFLIENPNDAMAGATFTHLVEGGGAPVVHGFSIAAHSRRTLYVNAVPGLAEASLSTVVTSDLPVVAERAMYITGGGAGRLFEAGTASAGTPTLSTNWSFAEGATGFFFTYLLLGNPQTSPADVTVVYQLPDGTTIPKTYTVQPQSRRTVDVRGEDALLASATFSMAVTSTQPIVAERAMWWGLPFYEGSVALGTTTTGAAWGIGEGAEAGVNDDSTFVLVSNGSASAATVRFTVVFDDGTTGQKDYVMPATSRLTVRIGTDFPPAVGRRFSVLVESLTPAAPVTVEYSRYQSAGGFLDSGGAALATRVR